MPDTVTIDLHLDTEGLDAELAGLAAIAPPPSFRTFAAEVGRIGRAAARAWTAALREVRGALAHVNTIARVAANDPARVAGLSARYQVRGGLGVASEQALDALVADLMRPVPGAPRDPDLLFLSVESRAVLAVAAIRGWVESRG